MNEPGPLNGLWGKISNSITIKIITMVILVLLLLIPTAMIKSLITEREHRKQEVIDEIDSKWGNEQTITGPIISIPYKRYNTDDKQNSTYTICHIYFLPDSLNIDGKVTAEKRSRGMYDAVVYNTELSLSGVFAMPKAELLNISPEAVIWQGAAINLGISDLRGIKKPVTARFNGDSLTMNSGLVIEDATQQTNGVNSPIDLTGATTPIPFSFELDLNGSYQFNIVPVGKQTEVHLESDWPDPSFTGDFLPVDRTITGSGFDASWTVLDLNRNFPQYWIGYNYGNQKSSLGVKFYVPVDIYQKSMRTAKYALMFIVFAFVAFFFSEIMNKLRVHPIQYLLIGLAIVLFYSLLISISEHTNFDIAYWLSCLAIIGLIAGYSKSIFKKNNMAMMVGGVLLVLYGYLYIILQLEDYALVMGSIGLFVVLALVMFLTRKVDWYNIKFEK
jgi:inner membrane protein